MAASRSLKREASPKLRLLSSFSSSLAFSNPSGPAANKIGSEVYLHNDLIRFRAQRSNNDPTTGQVHPALDCRVWSLRFVKELLMDEGVKINDINNEVYLYSAFF